MTLRPIPMVTKFTAHVEWSDGSSAELELMGPANTLEVELKRKEPGEVDPEPNKVVREQSIEEVVMTIYNLTEGFETRLKS